MNASFSPRSTCRWAGTRTAVSHFSSFGAASASCTRPRRAPDATPRGVSSRTPGVPAARPSDERPTRTPATRTLGSPSRSGSEYLIWGPTIPRRVK
eukprot:scaffold41434_cov63-Phaeocystis_antarctica.AAC.9